MTFPPSHLRTFALACILLAATLHAQDIQLPSAGGGGGGDLSAVDIDTFSELDTIVADETLLKASDIGGTLQGFLTVAALPADGILSSNYHYHEDALGTTDGWTLPPSPNAGDVIRIDAINSAASTITFATTSPYRTREGVTASLELDASTHQLVFVYSNGKWRMADSAVATETANYIYAGPTSGGAAVPDFRAMVAADIPADSIDASKMADADHGDVAWSSGVASVEAVAANAIGSAALADDAVDSDEIAAGAIDGEHLSADARGTFIETLSADHTLSFDPSTGEGCGSIHYVTATCDIQFPDAPAKATWTIIVEGAVTVSLVPDPAATTDTLKLEGIALDAGDEVDSTGATGDVAVVSYRAADTLFVSSNSWVDGGTAD